MNRNLATSVALIAATILVPTTSAMAQNRDAEIRFESAQRRFDGELAMFKVSIRRRPSGVTLSRARSSDQAACMIAMVCPVGIQFQGSSSSMRVCG